MKMKDCKGCRALGRVYNQEHQQNNGPFTCRKAKNELIRNLEKCPKK